MGLEPESVTAADPAGRVSKLCLHTAVEVGVSAAAVKGRLSEVGQGEVCAQTSERPAGAGKTFRRYDPDQVLPPAPVLGRSVAQREPAQLVSEPVESALERSSIDAADRAERGFPPYDPRLLPKPLLPRYATGLLCQLEAARCRGAAAGRRAAARPALERPLSRAPARAARAAAPVVLAPRAGAFARLRSRA